MARLTLEGVGKRFGEGAGAVTAVDGVDLEIEDGEFLVLVGPSGCGKSTTLRMVAGLETVTEGTIRLDGARINDQPPAERDIAMVFQSYALYPHMTVRGNMAFGLEQSTTLDESARADRVESTAELLAITDLLERKPGALSGGQRQRVALGRAIVREPAAFLMDEPLSNLDAKLRAQMRTELQELQADLDTTTVYVTHDQTEAMTMGDRIAILDGGELQQVARPLEAYHRPANRFVAGFIGEPSMNFLACELREDRLQAPGVEYPLEAAAAAVADLDAVTLGIRPEDIAVGGGAREEPGRLEGVAPQHRLETTISVVEPMGDRNVVHLQVEDGPELVASIDGLRQVETGERLSIGLAEEAIHLFDAETGEARWNRSLEMAPVRSV